MTSALLRRIRELREPRVDAGPQELPGVSIDGRGEQRMGEADVALDEHEHAVLDRLVDLGSSGQVCEQLGPHVARSSDRDEESPRSRGQRLDPRPQYVGERRGDVDRCLVRPGGRDDACQLDRVERIATADRMKPNQLRAGKRRTQPASDGQSC